MMTPQPIADDEINLLDYWRVLVKRKKLLGLIVGAAIIVSVIISLLLPKIYAASVSLLPPQDNSGGASLIASRIPGGLGGLVGGALGLKSPIDLWVGILNSRTVYEQIVSEFNLKAVYETESDEEAIKALKGSVSINKSKEQILSITVEDRDPERAAKLANAFVVALDQMNRGITTTSGGRMRAFVEGRLNEAKLALKKSEETLKVFQEENGAVQLDAQSTAIIGAIGEVNGQLLAKEVALRTLLSYATDQNPEVRLLKAEVKELKAALRKLEEGEGEGLAKRGSIFIPTAELPNLALQYVRLLRNAKIHETLFELLVEQFEIARIQEAKDSPTVQVLDAAIPPENRIKPKRGLIVILSTFSAGFFGVFVVFFLEYIEKAKKEEDAAIIRREVQ